MIHPLRQCRTAALWLHRHLLPADPGIGWMPYLWLVWTGFYFLPWAGSASGAAMKIATVVAVGLFLPLYFRFWWSRNAESRWIIAFIAALGFALIPFNAAGGGLLIYAGSFAGYSFRPRSVLALLAALCAAAIGEYLALGFPLFVWAWAPVIIVMAGLVNLWGAERHRQHRALERSQAQVKRLAAMAERERIGRDLHDLLGHTLTLITLKAELAAKLAERDLTGATREIREVEAISRYALQQVREAVGGYRKNGLAEELATARATLAAADVQLEESIASPRLSAQQDSALALALREAVTNIVRHSGARRCRLKLANGKDEVHFSIEDDGHGGELREGNGLAGMRERLREASGDLRIDSGPQGTRLTISVPAPESSDGFRRTAAG